MPTSPGRDRRRRRGLSSSCAPVSASSSSTGASTPPASRGTRTCRCSARARRSPTARRSPCVSRSRRRSGSTPARAYRSPHARSRRSEAHAGCGSRTRPTAPLETDAALALAGAHAQLEERASARRDSLRPQASRALESELARAESYYNAALESIDRRCASASAERVLLLEAQAEATRAEHVRRRREIEDEFRARHEIRPFRLHLLHVPSLLLPVEIRRGARHLLVLVLLATRCGRVRAAPLPRLRRGGAARRRPRAARLRGVPAAPRGPGGRLGSAARP